MNIRLILRVNIFGRERVTQERFDLKNLPDLADVHFYQGLLVLSDIDRVGIHRFTANLQAREPRGNVGPRHLRRLNRTEYLRINSQLTQERSRPTFVDGIVLAVHDPVVRALCLHVNNFFRSVHGQFNMEGRRVMEDQIQIQPCELQAGI